jgi:integrase
LRLDALRLCRSALDANNRLCKQSCLAEFRYCVNLTQSGARMRTHIDHCRAARSTSWTAGAQPVARLETGEKPRWRPRKTEILQGPRLAAVLTHAPAYRDVLELLAFTGLRVNEALGLRWCDIDHETKVIRVRQQLSRQRTPKRLKTDAGLRDVIMAPSVERLLQHQFFTASNRAPDDLVFSDTTGRGLDYRDIGEAFQAAVKSAGLKAHGRLTLHSLRHGFASMLIAQGLNVVFVSHQLGHAKPTTTLEVYAHLFDQAQHAHAAREALQATHEAMTLRPTSLSVVATR